MIKEHAPLPGARCRHGPQAGGLHGLLAPGQVRELATGLATAPGPEWPGGSTFGGAGELAQDAGEFGAFLGVEPAEIFLGVCAACRRARARPAPVPARSGATRVARRSTGSGAAGHQPLGLELVNDLGGRARGNVQAFGDVLEAQPVRGRRDPAALSRQATAGRGTGAGSARTGPGAGDQEWRSDRKARWKSSERSPGGVGVAAAWHAPRLRRTRRLTGNHIVR